MPKSRNWWSNTNTLQCATPEHTNIPLPTLPPLPQPQPPFTPPRHLRPQQVVNLTEATIVRPPALSTPSTTTTADAPNPSIYYVGIFLSGESRMRLLHTCPPVHSTVYAHHATLAFKPSLEHILSTYKHLIGIDVALTVLGHAGDDRTQALHISIPSWVPRLNLGGVPHVTISVAAGAEAREAGELMKHAKVAKTTTITATKRSGSSTSTLQHVKGLAVLHGTLGVCMTDRTVVTSVDELLEVLGLAPSEAATATAAENEEEDVGDAAVRPLLQTPTTPTTTTTTTNDPRYTNQSSSSLNTKNYIVSKNEPTLLCSLMDELHTAELLAKSSGGDGPTDTSSSIPTGTSNTPAVEPSLGVPALPHPSSSLLRGTSGAAGVVPTSQPTTVPPLSPTSTTDGGIDLASFVRLCLPTVPHVQPQVRGGSSATSNLLQQLPPSTIGIDNTTHQNDNGGIGTSSSFAITSTTRPPNEDLSTATIKNTFFVHPNVYVVLLHIYGNNSNAVVEFLTALQQQEAMTGTTASASGFRKQNTSSSAATTRTTTCTLVEVRTSTTTTTTTKSSSSSSASTHRAAAPADGSLKISRRGSNNNRSSHHHYLKNHRRFSDSHSLSNSTHNSVSHDVSIITNCSSSSSTLVAASTTQSAPAGASISTDSTTELQLEAAEEERAIMRAHQSARKAALSAQSSATSRNDPSTARLHHKAAKRFGEAASAARRRASLTAFNARNSEILNTFKIDLHGLHVQEAIQVLQRHLTVLGGLGHPGGTLLRVVTGFGAHSINGPKVLPAVLRLLAEGGYLFDMEEEFNPGLVRVLV